MNQRDVQTKIAVILDSLEKLNLLRAKTYEEFVADFRNVDSAPRRLQIAIQALLDIGSYIIASLGLRTPNTNAEIVEILSEASLISKAKTESNRPAQAIAT
jgi:uncharacterized protein YutE (UPF0331/DUF86 family)